MDGFAVLLVSNFVLEILLTCYKYRLTFHQFCPLFAQFFELVFFPTSLSQLISPLSHWIQQQCIINAQYPFHRALKQTLWIYRKVSMLARMYACYGSSHNQIISVCVWSAAQNSHAYMHQYPDNYLVPVMRQFPYIA